MKTSWLKRDNLVLLNFDAKEKGFSSPLPFKLMPEEGSSLLCPCCPQFRRQEEGLSISMPASRRRDTPQHNFTSNSMPGGGTTTPHPPPPSFTLNLMPGRGRTSAPLTSLYFDARRRDNFDPDLNDRRRQHLHYRLPGF
jgi:hypothetical protein